MEVTEKSGSESHRSPLEDHARVARLPCGSSGELDKLPCDHVLQGLFRL